MTTYLKTIILFSVILFINGGTITAQSEKGNVVIMNFSKFKFPDEVSVPEFDSLTYLYNTNVFEKNEYILNYKVIRHWWGNNTKDFIFIYEVKNWEDVIKASTRNNELFEEYWDTPGARKLFKEAYEKYFTVKHPDEIYREVNYDIGKITPLKESSEK
ncbi:MAG: hypothetical protein O6940_11685 [Ignavibacteria bacterium]|nr:hypothetical protein [Ignavibacteria bacterium]